SRRVAEHLHRVVHGPRHLVLNADRRRDGRRQIRSGLVCELGTGLGRVWEGLRRAGYHGALLFDAHDLALQVARPRFGLAEGSDQMVTPAAHALAEGSSLRIVEVSKHFASLEDPTVRIDAIESLSLEIQPGELVSVVGPSGCGKSTLLRLIAGLDAPDSG